MQSIKKLRRAKNESQKVLAEIIGVSLRTIQHYEAGTVDVSSKKLELIAQHYDVSVSYLFEGAKEKEVLVKPEKEFNNLKIDDKLNIIYSVLENVLIQINGTTEKVEHNEKLIAQANKNIFEQSMNIQKVLLKLETKSKKNKNLG